MGIFENMMRSREARAHSPAFQAEMTRENAEFVKVLGEFGNNTFDAGVGIILKTPTALFLNALKAMYDKKYSAGNWGKDAFGLFLGKDGVAHRTIKVVASAIHLAGQGVKIGIRQLFKY